MVTLAGSQVWWTWETEDSFRRVREGDKHAMKAYANKLTDQLSQLTGMVSCNRSSKLVPPVQSQIHNSRRVI